MRISWALLGIIISLGWIAPIVAANETSDSTLLKTGIHVHSTVSTGTFTTQSLQRMAKEAGLDAIVFNDSLLRKWTYGLWPLRDVIKRDVRQPDVMSFGVREYLAEIDDLNHSSDSDVIAVAGVEAAPFYFWKRPPWHVRGGQIRAWQRHLLVMGIQEPEDWVSLPLLTHSAYQGDAGVQPYQEFIDAVKEVNGLVFWAHPASRHYRKHGRVEDYTDPYPHLMRLAQNYDGIALTYLGYLQYLGVGDLWDQLLKDYLRGQRDKPVWIIGELDFRDNKRKLDKVTTVVQVKDKSPNGILEGLRNGRAWAVFQKEKDATEINSFELQYGFGGMLAQAGGQVPIESQGFLRVSGERSPDLKNDTVIHLIRNGELIAKRSVSEPHFDVKWRVGPWTEPTYYRIILEDEGSEIYTNPIFVR